MAEKSGNTEERVQIAIVNYIKLQYPNTLFTATMGGQFQKHFSQRLKAKRTGYLKGLKKDKKCYASKEQKEFITKALDRGYYGVVAKGFEQCKEIIDKYFKNEL